MGGFADGKDAEVGKLAEVVIAAGAAESIGGAGKAAFDGSAGVDGFKGTEEDAAGELFRVGGDYVGGVPMWHGRSIGRDAVERAAESFKESLVNHN